MHKILVFTLLVGMVFILGCTSTVSQELPILKSGTSYNLVIDKYTHNYVNNFNTEVYAFNGQIPGPIIEGTVGETLNINVTNHLGVATSIHWHGLLLENKQDGVPYVTQDPILPGETKKYTIPLVESGLYWYHSHFESHEQVERGLHGAFLIRDNNEPVVDNEIVLVLDDVLLGSSGEFRSFNLGRMHGRFGNILLANGYYWSTLNLTGEYNRLRLVNTANARSFNLYFGGKDVVVIGEGIGRVSPYSANNVIINPGERFDIILHSEQDETIHISHLTSRSNEVLMKLLVTVPEIERKPLDFSYTVENPFDNSIYEKEPDFTASLQGMMKPMMGLAWTINGKTYPDSPEKFIVKEGETVKIRVTNTQGQPHPMHLHGQKFMVLSRNGVKEENIVWRDTVMLNSRETADIAFIAQEKGTWVFHCHILEHAEAGMLSLIEVI